MHLNFGFQWQDLYDAEKLHQLQAHFLSHLRKTDFELYAQIYEKSTSNPESYLIPLAMSIEAFIKNLFHLTPFLQAHYDAHHQYLLASHFKRNFIQRDALYIIASAENIDGDNVLAQLSARLGQVLDPLDEISFAQLGLAALSREDHVTVDLFRQYAAWAFYSEEGKKRHNNGFLFKKPAAINPYQRFPMKHFQDAVVSCQTKPRAGFNLTDDGVETAHAVDEAFYCLKCHHRGKDTCRIGFKASDSTFKADIHGQPLSGCPLDQKISQMNVLFEHGQIIAALAVITLDNPLVAATGHRICYDCSRSCIFQKQDPVDIPSIETRILKDVLALPYGFEIYSLLTRWNPLNLASPYPKIESGYQVLVVGQGPSGFALAHLLMQQGHSVTAIDGLKIEPLPADLKDTAVPIKDIFDHYEVLSEGYAKGFGGVAEYGITVRWDKNFLLIIRLLLERRHLYQCLDGVRFGSSITLDAAFQAYGFDHVALCLGAGSPTILPLENVTVPGVRLASDFLMALHLGDAAKINSKTTLRIQLPVAVIGAGLTAVDAATEALAYYPIQVMNFYLRYRDIIRIYGEEKWNEISRTDLEVAETFLEHGKIIYEEYVLAHSEGRQPNYLPYLKEWGGVTIYYRKKIHDAPAYRLNPHELKKALDEGVKFIEEATLEAVVPNAHGRLSMADFNIASHSQRFSIKTLLIAAGTKPNTVLAQEFQELKLEGDFFKALDSHPFFVASSEDGRYVSYLGDLHPDYSGSVVKALASAKAAAPIIHESLLTKPPYGKTFNKDLYVSKVEQININDDLITLKIHSPAAAKAYQPGNFFKLQPYGADYTEAIPLSPISIDPIEGNIVFKIQIVGATTRLLKNIQKNERVFLMGPAGSKLNIPCEHKILFITDPNSRIDVTAAIRAHLSNISYQITSFIEDLSLEDFKGFDSVFISGSAEFIQAFKQTYSALPVPCYTFVYTHLQCMMKQVCAQCIYTVTDPNTGFNSVQFGCAKSIETIDKISYPFLNKRNKNERLEEIVLDCWSVIAPTHPYR